MSNPGAPQIRIALESRLAALAGVIETAWENVTYTPVAGRPYQQANLLFATPVNPEMGRFYIENGYLQVSLRYPINSGPAAIGNYAQSIRDWFYRGLQVASGGVTVTISNTPAIGSGSNDGDRYVVPVKIRFTANNAN